MKEEVVKNSRILVVEDESIVARDIQKTLEGFGYEVPETASTAEEAIRKAETIRPNLIIMDIKLRGKPDGIEAIESIRQKYKIPVIYLTAYADNDLMRRARITEPFGYILKPFNENDLKNTVEMALYKNEVVSQLLENLDTVNKMRKLVAEAQMDMAELKIQNAELKKKVAEMEKELSEKK